MYSLRVSSDLEEGRDLWQRMIPPERVADLWAFRACFQKHFRRPPLFVVVEDDGRLCGFLPLSWIEENGSYGYFPGEVWQEKTWLEQNRVIVRDEKALRMMLTFLENRHYRYHLRYLVPSRALPATQMDVDEIGYLFVPPDFNYDMENYFQLFSHKSVKRIKQELADLEGKGLKWRFDDPADFDLMVKLNLDRYGAYSYFNDDRFTAGFRELMHYLAEQGWLRFITVLLEGEPAAVDMGVVYRGAYTLLAGGTNGRFPGVAKLINLFHMRRGCEERLNQVDFLCGDFSWKSRFHLFERPLYRLSNLSVPAVDRPAIQPAITAINRPDLGSSARV